MSLFRRHAAPSNEAPLGETDPAVSRYQVVQCAGCSRRTPPYVYMSNGKDYCLPCAKQVARIMRVHPAGKRADDIKTLDL
ncbi:MAG: hypothetical protein R3C39_00320 [Dehalococcoidia bacterium]